MRILITAPDLNPLNNVSGISFVVRQIIHYNKEHEYKHYLLGRPDKGLNVLIWLFQLIKQLLVFPFSLIRFNTELVHQNVPFDTKGIIREFFINIWCRLFNIPVLLHIHGGEYFTNEIRNLLVKRMAKTLICSGNKVVVLSENEQKKLKQMFGHGSADVLANGIDTQKYKPSLIKEIAPKPNFLYLGRIEKDKGILEIVEAFRYIQKQYCFSFTLCGFGSLTNHVKEECEKILGTDFIFKGIVCGAEKLKTIHESNYFLLPSYFEGLPISLLETMAAGVVPIVTNVGSISSVVENELNGIFVLKYNSIDLAEKIKKVITDKTLYEFLSKNAIQTITEKFDIKEYIAKLNAIYIRI